MFLSIIYIQSYNCASYVTICSSLQKTTRLSVVSFRLQSWCLTRTFPTNLLSKDKDEFSVSNFDIYYIDKTVKCVYVFFLVELIQPGPVRCALEQGQSSRSRVVWKPLLEIVNGVSYFLIENWKHPYIWYKAATGDKAKWMHLKYLNSSYDATVGDFELKTE